MARRKRRFNDGPLKLTKVEEWQKLVKPENNVRNFEEENSSRFLGFRIIPGSTNQLWRWDTLEEVDPQKINNGATQK